MKNAWSQSADNPVVYPTSDGKPMAESDLHRVLMVDLIQTLEGWFAADPQTYVTGNLLLYYVKGKKRKRVAPDVFFTRGIQKRPRDYYLLWEEGVSPQVVIEVSSSSTASEDTKKKKALYQDVLKVAEYFIFDPRQEYLEPSFQFFKLLNGVYVTVPVEKRFHSDVLGLDLAREGWDLRFFDPATGRKLLTRKEELEELRARYAERNGH